MFINVGHQRVSQSSSIQTKRERIYIRYLILSYPHLYPHQLGPYKLAANLFSQQGGNDCLTQTSPGPELLANPEPDFYILGIHIDLPLYPFSKELIDL